ncbi:MAG: hypothetical protein IJF11_02630 [Clostridia bacterium]|nr:hypothetical protein [Clostridia bacterium]
MKNPLITMSALVGNPSDKDIFNYLNGLKQNGIDEVMIYPRSGCLIEYLSEEWFFAIQNFIKSAEALEMSLWLYDDFNWPSGDACGRVTKNESFRLKSIKIEGDDIGKISSKSKHNSDIFGEKFFPDLMNPKAVDYFISLTHEEYYKRFGNYFGTVIKGIFTDEPSIGYCSQNGYLPYYDGMEDDYKASYDKDFFHDLLSHSEDFCKNAMKLASAKFKEAYIDKLSSWCKSHGILMTGHLMCDNEPFYSVKYNGDFLKNLSAFHLPGIDEIATCLEDRSLMALLGGIEYAGKGKGAMAELFALGPCDMSYAKKRCMLYLTACHGVDHYFLAISHMDISGNMHVCDYFSDFAVAQPDFSGMRLLSEEAKIACELAKKDYSPDLYIRFPTDNGLKNASRDFDLTVLFSLLNELAYHGIQWKYTLDEMPTDAPIIELDDTPQLILNGNAVSIGDVVSRFDKKAITGIDGECVKGIFRRRFNDGTTVILNLYAPEGEYIIDGEIVYLYEHDVLLNKTDLPTKKEAINSSFTVNYCNPNIVRLMCLNDSKNAFACADCELNVRFAVRKDTEIKIDGSLPELDTDYNPLPKGICEHYNITKVQSIKTKKTIIECQNDLKYMPSVMVVGDFSANIINGETCGVNLTKRKRAYNVGEKIADFGKVEFLARVRVPQGAVGIELLGTKLYTVLYLEGSLTGEKITAPYIFDIEKELWGEEIELKIVQFSSIGPIFGDVDYWDKNAKRSQWRGTPSSGETYFGFDEINWIY